MADGAWNAPYDRHQFLNQAGKDRGFDDDHYFNNTPLAYFV